MRRTSDNAEPRGRTQWVVLGGEIQH